MSIHQSLCYRILVNSLPKSGTHLLRTVLSLYPQIQFSGVHLGDNVSGYYLWKRLHFSLSLFNWMRKLLKLNQVGIGVDLPHYASKREIQRALARVPLRNFATAHLPYSEIAAQVLQGLDYKIFIMLRDPRDVAVSFSHYVAKNKNHLLYECFTGLSHSEQLLAAITGIETRGIFLRPLDVRYKSILDWIDQTGALVVRFEDLIGVKGGGSQDVQLAQIMKITNFLGLAIDDFDPIYIAQHAFSPSSNTFRKGQIGSWREEFQAEHIHAVKATCGQFIIDLGYETNNSW